MNEEIQEVYLSLEDEWSGNELILVWAFPYGVQRDKTYQVRHFKHQYEAVQKIAEALSEEDGNFLDRLVKEDERKTEVTPNKKRWVSRDKSNLTEHKIHEIDGFYLKLKHDRIQQRKFAEMMCEAADVKYLEERPKL
jgi:hypothetical protein